MRVSLPTKAGLLKKIKDAIKPDYEGYLIVKGSVVVFDFGKHLGKRLQEVPTAYLLWMLRAKDPEFPKCVRKIIQREVDRRPAFSEVLYVHHHMWADDMEDEWVYDE